MEMELGNFAIFKTMQLFSISEASKWATDYIGKNVTTSNIAYLVQYGLIRKIGENGTTKNKMAYSETIFHLRRK